MKSLSHSCLANRIFDWQSALLCAELSQLAYQSNNAIEYLLPNRWAFPKFSLFEQSNTSGFFAIDDLVCVLVFRGKSSIGDWLASLSIEHIDMPYGSVHKQTHHAWSEVKEIVERQMSSLSGSIDTIWITGHSFGGAIATIAAAELQDNQHIAGCYTFGQPRVGRSDFPKTIETRYPNSFLRFVNDDDIVTRIPPSFLHCGQPIEFDSQGQLDSDVTVPSEQRWGSVSMKSMGGIQSQLKEILNENEIPKEVENNAPFLRSVKAGMEGFLPSFRSHEISRYIAAIRRQIPNENSDVSVEAIIGSKTRGMRSLTATRGDSNLEGVVTKGADTEEELLPILMRTRTKNWEPYADLKVNSRLGAIVTAIATPSQIERLRKDPNVASIDISRDAGIHECQVSVPFVGGDAVHVPPLDERGSHALVGLIDSGIDVLHEAFLDANGKTRIVAIWNQRDATGLSPKKADPTFTQDYGTLYDQDAIQKFVDGTNNPSTALRDPQQHGTHVASIAAGRKVGGFAGGVAPESRIAVIIPNMQTNPGDPPSIGYSNSHVDALVFLQKLSQKLDLPIAINVSLGMNAGAHDGMSTLESAFDAITDNGRDPGIAIVKSAGNERGFAGHAKIQAMAGGVTTLAWNSNSSFRFQDYIEVWYSGVDELDFMLVAPDGNKSPLINAANPKTVSILGGNRCSLELITNHPDNGDNLLAIRIRPEATDIQSGQWKLEVTGSLVFSENGRVDAWVERDDKARAVTFTSGDNDEMTLSIPGTANSVITVAACEPAVPVRLTANSSFGPTRKSSPKPELTAPGEKIVAALANDDSDHQATIALSGTSMAAPHVTGAIALAFSRRNKNSALAQLNAQQIRTALLKNLKNRTQIHNVGFGFGILNIKPFFESLS
jgi:subtilisin family serine protease